jgi:hypothetical protein
MTAIQIGSFVIPIYYLVIGISVGFSYSILLFSLKNHQEKQGVITSLYLNSVLITVLTWKFSPVLLNPLSIINEPMIILYQRGTTMHFLFGVILSILYIILSSRKLGIPIRLVIDLFPFLYVSFLFMYNLLTPKPEVFQIPLNIILAIVYLYVFYQLWKIRKEIGTLKLTYKFCINIGLIYLILSFFEQQDIAFGGISTNQFYFIVLTAIGLLKPKVIKLRKEVS